jgi:hypothetical protein
MDSREPLDAIGMIFEWTSVDPCGRAQPLRDALQTSRPLLDRDVIDGTESSEVGVGEVIDTPGFDPRTKRRGGSGSSTRPDDHHMVGVFHEKSPVPCGSQDEASLSFG